MKFSKRAESAAADVTKALGVSPDKAQTEAVARAIEKAIIDSYEDAAERCAKVAVECCSEDRDMAHKIAEEIRRRNIALIANLSSLR